MNVLSCRIIASSNHLSCNGVLFDALLRCMYITSLMHVSYVILRLRVRASHHTETTVNNQISHVHDAKSRGGVVDLVVAVGCENSAIMATLHRRRLEEILPMDDGSRSPGHHADSICKDTGWLWPLRAKLFATMGNSFITATDLNGLLSHTAIKAALSRRNQIRMMGSSLSSVTSSNSISLSAHSLTDAWCCDHEEVIAVGSGSSATKIPQARRHMNSASSDTFGIQCAWKYLAIIMQAEDGPKYSAMAS